MTESYNSIQRDIDNNRNGVTRPLDIKPEGEAFNLKQSRFFGLVESSTDYGSLEDGVDTPNGCFRYTALLQQIVNDMKNNRVQDAQQNYKLVKSIKTSSGSTVEILLMDALAKMKMNISQLRPRLETQLAEVN
jgi:hypothetical protein